MLSSKKEDVESRGSWEDLVGMKVCLIGSQLLVILGDCMPEECPSKHSGWTDSVEQS